MRHRYPFDALHWLRHKRVDQRAAVVTESAARTAQAAHAELCATAERASAERAIAVVACAERARLGDGLMRAGELRVVDDWRKGADAELRGKAEQEQRAREAHVSQAAAEVQARRDLGTASSEAKVIDTHRGSFRAERAAAEERSEEEAAAEQWTASHFPPRRG
ncbi:MAG: hypothetical protein ABI488_26645 [Polyangiaceae bacterium]